MTQKSLSVFTKDFIVQTRGNGVDIDIYDCDAFSIVDCFGADTLLDEIGKETVMEYFDLIEKGGE